MHSFLIICSISASIGCDNHLLWISSPSWIIWIHYFTSCSLWGIIQPLLSHDWLLIIHSEILCFFLSCFYGTDKGVWGLPVQHSQCVWTASVETRLQGRWQRKQWWPCIPWWNPFCRSSITAALVDDASCNSSGRCGRTKHAASQRSGTTDAVLQHVPRAPILGEPWAKQTTLTGSIKLSGLTLCLQHMGHSV